MRSARDFQVNSPATYLQCDGVDANLEEGGGEIPLSTPSGCRRKQHSQADFRLWSLHHLVVFAADLKLLGHVNTTLADCLAKLKWELVLILERFA